jgi:hypothetical protein
VEKSLFTLISDMRDTFLTKKFLYYPLLLVLFLFGIDKLFSLEIVRKYTESRPEFTFYDIKKKLLHQLKEFNLKKTREEKLLVLLGTSHMGEFSHEYIRSKNQNWTTYNFSSPMATPSYLYYNLETILNSGIKPDYIVFEIIPETFREEANEYALKFSYDHEFIFKNWKNFSKKELEAYTSANLFSLVRFPAKLNTVWKRIKDPKASAYLEFFYDKVDLAVTQNNGGIPNPILVNTKEDDFEKEAFKFFLQNFSGTYKESNTQIYFFKKLIQTCIQNQIKLLVYKPIVSKPYQKLLNESSFYKNWWKSKTDFIKENQLPYLDMAEFTEKIQCRKFVDVHHLSGGCYPEITDILLDSLKEVYP